MKVATLEAYDEWELNFWIETFEELLHKSKDAAYREVLEQLVSKRVDMQTRRDDTEEDIWND